MGAFSRQSSGMMMDYSNTNPALSPYQNMSPMMPASSGASVMLTPPLQRPMSMNLTAMSSGGSVAPGMGGLTPIGGMNTMGMPGMTGMNNTLGMNNMSMNNMNAMGMNNMSMNNMSMNNMNAMPNLANPMTPLYPTSSTLSPMMMNTVGTTSGLSPMMGGLSGNTVAANMSGMNLMTGLSPYGTPNTAGLIPLSSPSQGFNPLMDPTGQLSTYMNSPVGRMSMSGATSTMASMPNMGLAGMNAAGLGVGGMPMVGAAGNADPALELALRQSMVESTPRWMVDQNFQAAREEQLKKQNDELLEKAIRQSLDETNLHRLVSIKNISSIIF